MSLNLGFCIDAEPWRLSRGFHPSKVGGKPVWLIPENLPQRTCPRCQCQLRFVLQIYAPGGYSDAGDEDASFHRTVYLFVCASKNGCTGGAVAYRQQLPEKNSFYPAVAPDYEDPAELAKLDVSHPVKQRMCNVCGFASSFHCASCKLVSYCSKECQVLDWKEGGHRDVCKKKKQASEVKNPFALNEFELVSEEAVDDRIPDSEGDDDEEDDEITAEEAQKEADNVAQTMNREKFGDMDENEALVKELEDAKFQAWNTILAKEAEQVIRYNRGAEFLVPIDQSELDFEPGCCEACGTERTFEFQTTPHIMVKSGLEFSGGDLATILLFTCPKDCAGKKGATFVTEKAAIVLYRK